MLDGFVIFFLILRKSLFLFIRVLPSEYGDARAAVDGRNLLVPVSWLPLCARLLSSSPGTPWTRLLSSAGDTGLSGALVSHLHVTLVKRALKLAGLIDV